MSIVRDMIQEVRDDGGTEKEAIDHVLNMLTLEQYREYTRPILADGVRRVYREHVRQMERDYKAAIATPGYDPTAERIALLQETFSLPDGTRVAWGKATAAQHLERAQWQRGRAAAANSDAAVHEDAARRILAAGVACLDDLEDAAA